MKVPQCEKELTVSEMLHAGRWPEACDPALRLHVKGCAACSEIVLVAQFLREERASMCADAKLPDAGLVWWKAQLRARREALEFATRPIALAERFAAACGLVCLLACITWKWNDFHHWLGRLESFSISDARRFLSLLLNSWNQPFSTVLVASTSLLVIFMACLVCALWAEK